MALLATHSAWVPSRPAARVCSAPRLQHFARAQQPSSRSLLRPPLPAAAAAAAATTPTAGYDELLRWW